MIDIDESAEPAGDEAPLSFAATAGLSAVTAIILGVGAWAWAEAGMLVILYGDTLYCPI